MTPSRALRALSLALLLTAAASIAAPPTGAYTPASPRKSSLLTRLLTSTTSAAGPADAGPATPAAAAAAAVVAATAATASTAAASTSQVTPALRTTLPNTTERRRRRRQRRRRSPFCKRPVLVCAFHGTELGGSKIGGSVTFTTVRKGRRCAVWISAEVRGLEPGPHGFHIHAWGDVRGSDGKSAGGHFVGPWNRNAIHGWPWSKRRHWGCLGNLYVNKLGIGRYNRVDWRIQTPKIVGRSMIIHAGADLGPEYQPSGASGPRVAKCVIGYANPEYKEEL